MSKKAHQSKTMMFSFLLAVMGGAESQLHLIRDDLGDYYGLILFGVSIAVAALRFATREGVEL